LAGTGPYIELELRGNPFTAEDAGSFSFADDYSLLFAIDSFQMFAERGVSLFIGFQVRFAVRRKDQRERRFAHHRLYLFGLAFI